MQWWRTLWTKLAFACARGARTTGEALQTARELVCFGHRCHPTINDNKIAVFGAFRCTLELAQSVTESGVAAQEPQKLTDASLDLLVLMWEVAGR